MAFVKLTQPGGTAVILNTDHVVQCAAAPEGSVPAGAATRITYISGGYQDVTESIETVEQRFKFH